MRRIACAVFGFAVILGAASLGLTRHAEAAPRSVLKALDTDNDGTVDLVGPRRQLQSCSIGSTVTMTARLLGVN
jgi:hypothetical protein